MRILVVGSGGREHALVWRLGRDSHHEIYAIPGNPGIAKIASCLPATTLSPAEILTAANEVDAELTIIGPEGPLVAGVVDRFHAARRPIVGPSAAAARLEGSKIFAKNFFQQHAIPTARYEAAETREQAISAAAHFDYPLVVKADGLAAGKGVAIVNDRREAEDAIDSLGPRLIVEEFLSGPELSFIVLSDGKTVVPLAPSRDHKRIFENERGPNTGGMGAYCDRALLDHSQTALILDSIIRPTVEATAYTGFLYAGLILTPAGPKVLEFNVRLGDPEAQAILTHLEGDFAAFLSAASTGDLPGRPLDWHAGASVCVVMAARGYPGQPNTGDFIRGLEAAEETGSIVFHAGTKVAGEGYVTNGGRVLGVTGSGPSLPEAADIAYAGVAKITFQGLQFRRDIGRPYDKAMGT